MSDMDEGVITPHHYMVRAKERLELGDMAGARKWCERAMELDETLSENALVKEIMSVDASASEGDMSESKGE